MERLFKKHIQEVVIMKENVFFKRWRLISSIFFLLLSAHSCAIDNPDTKDGVAQFEERSKQFKVAIENPSNSSRAYSVAYDNYQNFLDDELNKVYGQLKSKLSLSRKAELEISQKNWLKFRDSEFLLIDNNWTKENFGSSYIISRGGYRCTLIEHRIRELLNYSANY